MDKKIKKKIYIYVYIELDGIYKLEQIVTKYMKCKMVYIEVSTRK